MRMDGRRESSNVDDRRGQGGGMGFSGGGGGFNLIAMLLQMFLSSRRSGGNAGGGCGKGGCLVGIVVAALLMILSGNGDTLFSLLGLVSGSGIQTEQTMTQGNNEYQGSAQEEQLATFAKQILAGTEDVWTEIFEQMGRRYEPPRLVLFSGSVQSGCGGATSSTGPFYCSADQSVYLDLSFFMNMKRELGADGDFAYAYVIAHEVGHHVQYLLGTLTEAHQAQRRVSEKESNQISVRLELQADFYAGVWAYHDNKRFLSLEDGDIDEALDAARKIGDDYLQKQARGYTVPESFNHGTSAQRSKWLKMGVQTGDIRNGDTFSQAYNAL